MYKIENIKNSILCGDALQELKLIPDGSIDTIITSPPYYALRNYQVKGQLGLEKSFDEYKTKLLEIIAEIKRVLKPSGCFFLNLGDIYGGTRWTNQPGTGPWKENSFSAKANINPKRGFKSSTQGDRMYSNPEGLGKASDGSKCLSMMPERIALAMCDQQGWILRNRIVWAKQILDFREKRTKGSVMPTSVKDRFNESWEYLYFFVKNKKYYSDLDAVRLKPQTFENRPGGFTRSREFKYDSKRLADYSPQSKQSGQRFNYRVRDAKREKGQSQFKTSEEEIKRYNEIPKDYGKKKLVGIDDKKLGNRWMSGTPNFVKQNKVNDPRVNHEDGPGSWRDFKDANSNDANEFNPLGKNLPTIWLIGAQPHNFKKELGVETDHFATFPQGLCEIPIKFGCPPKGIVLDPFCGSGTTAVVARALGRNYLGIELNESYIAIANRRLAQQTLL